MESTDLMSGASEMGSLTARSNEESQFVGSSSGVYFVNTVRQAFSQNLNQSSSSSSSPSGQGCFPSPEETLVGSEDSPRDKQHVDPSSPSVVVGGDVLFLSHWKYAPAVAAQLGDAPSVDVARELMMVYFRAWHPLFPFLHSPTFLQAMELLYAGYRGQDTTMTAPNQPPLHDHRSACWTVILQCVFNLASLLRPDLHLPPNSQIDSPSSVYPLLGTLSCRHDLSSLQALLAAQLYLVAKMSLRTASTVGGCILRSMLHAGLHRCPFRYKELSSHDRQLRKRIFWCAYAVDRYLSQALGLPLGIQDSDVDVCPPGASEVHVPGVLVHRPGKPPSKNGNQRSKDIEDQCKREAALASYVESGKLTGHALELFHKSILVRSIRRSTVLYLASDVHKWWNSLPRDLQSNPISPSSSSSSSTNTNANTNSNQPFNFGPFFIVLYHHLILLINRPFLSLAPSTPEFCSALQTCIGAARGILAALSSQVEQGQPLFWPGFLSAAWMSGLVLAFACRLGQYVLGKGCQEINECLEVLGIMSAQWETAKHCHSALALLSTNIRQSAHTQISYPHDSASRDEHITTATRNKKRKIDHSAYPVNPTPTSTTQNHTNPEDNHHKPLPDQAPFSSSIMNPSTNPHREDSTLPDLRLDYEIDLTLSPDYDHNLSTIPNIPGISPSLPSFGVGGGVGNFDLDMVGLLQDVDNGVFDFELFGSRFPSF